MSGILKLLSKLYQSGMLFLSFAAKTLKILERGERDLRCRFPSSGSVSDICDSFSISGSIWNVDVWSFPFSPACSTEISLITFPRLRDSPPNGKRHVTPPWKSSWPISVLLRARLCRFRFRVTFRRRKKSRYMHRALPGSKQTN